MTNINNIRFDYKFLCIVIGGICAWYDLKTDFKVFKATTELRLESIEGKKSTNNQLSYLYKEAIMPAEIRIEHDDK